MNDKISIIVPIYKVENYLQKCIDSICKQTYIELELILVDDGSPDECPYLCDKYASIDSRIRVLHKKNGGLSDARNAGLRIATGKYVLFVDSDDYIELDTCARFISIANKYGADIVTGEARQIENDQIIPLKNYNSGNEICTGKQYLKLQLKSDLWRISAWINFYKRDFLIENNLFFKFGIYHEDTEWTPRVFYLASKVISLNYCFYNYIVRDGSIMTQKSTTKSSKDLMVICKKNVEYFSGISDRELQALLYNHMIRLYFWAFSRNFTYYIKHKKDVDRSFPKTYGVGKKMKFWTTLFFLNLEVFHYVYIFRIYIKNI